MGECKLPTYHGRHHEIIIPPALVKPANSDPEPQDHTDESNRHQCQFDNHEARTPGNRVDIVGLGPVGANFWRRKPHYGRS